MNTSLAAKGALAHRLQKQAGAELCNILFSLIELIYPVAT